MSSDANATAQLYSESLAFVPKLLETLESSKEKFVHLLNLSIHSFEFEKTIAPSPAPIDLVACRLITKKASFLREDSSSPQFESAKKEAAASTITGSLDLSRD